MNRMIALAASAAGLSVFAITPSVAAPTMPHQGLSAPSTIENVACRTVKKTVWKNGKKRVVTTRSCDRPRRVFRNGRWYYDRPGIGIRIR